MAGVAVGGGERSEGIRIEVPAPRHMRTESYEPHVKSHCKMD